MKHNHSGCDHELKFCKICDVVYCTKCSEEWKKNWANWTYPVSTTTTGTWNKPATVYYGASSGTVDVFSVSNHAHDTHTGI